MSEQEWINLCSDGAYILLGKTDIRFLKIAQIMRSGGKKDIQGALVAYYKRTLTSIKTSRGAFLRK